MYLFVFAFSLLYVYHVIYRAYCTHAGPVCPIFVSINIPKLFGLMNKQTLSVGLAFAMFVVASAVLLLWMFQGLDYLREFLNAVFRFLLACYVLVLLWKK